MQPAEQEEMQTLFARFGFVPDPECPPQLLRAHTSLVYFLLRAFVAHPRAAVGLLSAVVEWYRRYDELAAAQPSEGVFATRAGRVHLRLACRPGCNHCCHSPVSAVGAEALTIAAYIAVNFSAAERAALDARTEARVRLQAGDRDHHALCPLNVDGRCQVYPVRPLNCRKWHSFDESACRRAFRDDDPTAEIPRASVRADASGLIWQSAVAAFTAIGVDVSELDLIPALQLALHGDDVPARFVAGEPVFAAARRQVGEPPASG